MLKARLYLCAALAVCSGCHCGPTTTTKPQPDFIVSPNTLSFPTTCPVVDDAGHPTGAAAEVLTFTLRNVGTVSGPVAISLGGNGQAAFSWDAGAVPSILAGGASADIPVTFAPLGPGDVTATLSISDGVPDGGTSVALEGTGSGGAPQPQLRVAYETAPDSGQYTACVGGVLCEATWPLTFYDQTSDLRLKITNGGCAPLAVTGFNVTGVNTPVAFSLNQPSTPPSPSVPWRVGAPGGPTEQIVDVRFQPEQDPNSDTSFINLLAVRSNDPAQPDAGFQMYLLGSADKPAVNVNPTFCNFTDPNDTCGGGKDGGVATFSVSNGSASATIQIDSITFVNGGQGGRFTLGPQNPQGQSLAPGAILPLDITYTDAPVYAADRVVIAASSGGVAAGTATLDVSGGVLPSLVTSLDPMDQLVFQNPDAGGLNVQSFRISDALDAGTLTVNGVTVEPNPYFSLGNTLDAGTQLASGQSLPIQVNFQAPISGGFQTGVLHIATNDPAFGPPSYKVVTLYSSAPLNQLPVAVIEGIDAQGALHQGQMNVSMSALGGTLTVTGRDSFHPLPDGGTEPVAGYLFRLARTPAGSTATLAVDGTQTTQQDDALSFGTPALAGEYDVTLQVFDSTGQASGNVDILKIFATP